VTVAVDRQKRPIFKTLPRRAKKTVHRAFPGKAALIFRKK
jgi:hypothetical protein